MLDDTVVLHNARPEDSAIYQCDASNSHGSILANINIMVMSEYQSKALAPHNQLLNTGATLDLGNVQFV